jgi:hypothetical protein
VGVGEQVTEAVAGEEEVVSCSRTRPFFHQDGIKSLWAWGAPVAFLPQSIVADRMGATARSELSSSPLVGGGVVGMDLTLLDRVDLAVAAGG